MLFTINQNKERRSGSKIMREEEVPFFEHNPWEEGTIYPLP